MGVPNEFVAAADTKPAACLQIRGAFCHNFLGSLGFPVPAGLPPLPLRLLPARAFKYFLGNVCRQRRQYKRRPVYVLAGPKIREKSFILAAPPQAGGLPRFAQHGSYGRQLQSNSTYCQPLPSAGHGHCQYYSGVSGKWILSVLPCWS